MFYSLKTGRTHRVAADAVAAQIEPDGLYYATNVGGAQPGRVTFIPISRVRAWCSG